MKIRNGFVSNSSSSSFVAIGVVIPRDRISKLEFCKKMGYVKEDCEEDDLEENIEEIDPLTGRYYYDLISDCFFDHEESGAPKGKTVIGKKYRIDEETDGFVANLSEVIKDLSEQLKRFDLENEPLQLIISTELC